MIGTCFIVLAGRLSSCVEDTKRIQILSLNYPYSIYVLEETTIETKFLGCCRRL